MEKSKNPTFLKVFTAVTFLAMVAANALANILPINNVNTGQVSDSFPNLFAPAGITFSIWGVIYLLLAGYTLYHIGFFRGGKKNVNDELLKKTGVTFSISSLANTAWIFSWHYLNIPLSMLLMVIILICLIYITLAISKSELSARDRIFIRLPFSVYFGWITVATIANATTLLVSLGWNGFELSEELLASIVIVVGLVIGTATTIKFKDIAYGLVLIWAYTGILIKHTSESGFAGQYTGLITTVAVSIVLLAVALAYVIFSKKRPIPVK